MAQAHPSLQALSRPTKAARFEQAMPENTVLRVARILDHGRQGSATPPPLDPIDSVFETNELLHQILSDVPAEYRHRLRRVSTSWNSVLLKIGWHINPTALYSESLAEFSPIYVTEKGIHINPVLSDASVKLSWWNKGCRPGWPQYITFATKYNHKTPEGHAALMQHQNEYLTSPPITMLSLAGNAADLYPRAVAILRVDGGIRVGDLLEVFGKVEGHFIWGERGDWEPNYDLVWKPFGCFAESKIGYRGDYYMGTRSFER